MRTQNTPTIKRTYAKTTRIAAGALTKKRDPNHGKLCKATMIHNEVFAKVDVREFLANSDYLKYAQTCQQLFRTIASYRGMLQIDLPRELKKVSRFAKEIWYTKRQEIARRQRPKITPITAPVSVPVKPEPKPVFFGPEQAETSESSQPCFDPFYGHTPAEYRAFDRFFAKADGVPAEQHCVAVPEDPVAESDSYCP